MANPWTWLRAWAKSAVLSGIGDALEQLHEAPPPDLAARLAALADRPALEAADKGKTEKGGRRG